jgi:hypothetical protein
LTGEIDIKLLIIRANPEVCEAMNFAKNNSVIPLEISGVPKWNCPSNISEEIYDEDSAI